MFRLVFSIPARPLAHEHQLRQFHFESLFNIKVAGCIIKQVSVLRPGTLLRVCNYGSDDLAGPWNLGVAFTNY